LPFLFSHFVINDKYEEMGKAAIVDRPVKMGNQLMLKIIIK
jgi:hypothetical protein